MALTLQSSAFPDGGQIPVSFTCDGANVSPPLSWTGVPQNTKSFALICDDPDAPVGTWVHWLVYEIPADVTRLPEHVPAQEETAQGFRQGLNDFRNIGYGGPCPPEGIHRYIFKLYALDFMPDLEPGISREELLLAMEGHILEEAQLTGRYSRR